MCSGCQSLSQAWYRKAPDTTSLATVRSSNWCTWASKAGGWGVHACIGRGWGSAAQGSCRKLQRWRRRRCRGACSGSAHGSGAFPPAQAPLARARPEWPSPMHAREPATDPPAHMCSRRRHSLAQMNNWVGHSGSRVLNPKSSLEP